MDPQIKNALGEGLVDALGFISGGLAGGLLASFLGFEFMRESDWSSDSLIGILFVGLGAGLGKTLARKSLRR